MSDSPNDDIVPSDLGDLIAQGDLAQVQNYLSSRSRLDARRAVASLSAHLQAELFTMLPPEVAADLLDEIPESQATELLDNIEPREAASILEEMKSDEQADLLQQTEHAEEILAVMDQSDAREARELIEYPTDVAGGLMKKEYLSFAEATTLREVISHFQTKGGEYSDYEIQYIYVVAGGGELRGVVPLRDLLLKSGDLPISAVMVKNPRAVPVMTPLDSLRTLFQEYSFIGVPVIDLERRLVGVVLRRSVDEALAERSDEAMLRRQGLIEEELRSMPTLIRSRRRLSWLSLNIMLNLVSASVISAYESTLQVAISLAVFLPIISDMCGCAGNQAVAVTLRELTLGLVRPRDVWRVLFAEIKVGVLNGLVLGLLVGVVAFVWKGNPYLGLVVASALAISTVIAVLVGASIPLLLKAFRADPALAAGPLLTTITDLSGFFFALWFATMLLQHLR